LLNAGRQINCESKCEEKLQTENITQKEEPQDYKHRDSHGRDCGTKQKCDLENVSEVQERCGVSVRRHKGYIKK
jgi:hypothetical protein